MWDWLAKFGSSNKLSVEEVARLSELTRELAVDYGTPELPNEFRNVAERGEETGRYFAELANAAQIASFIYQIARDVIPLMRTWARGSKEEQASMEPKLIEAAEKLITPQDSPALAMKKRGLIRRVVDGLLRKG